MFWLLLACALTSEVPTNENFAATFSTGFACSPESDGVVLKDAENTLRLQASHRNDEPLIVVFSGTDLDASSRGDDDLCDDLPGDPTEQRVVMAWSLTAGDFSLVETEQGRSLHLEGVVLSPAGEYAPYSDDFEDPEDHAPFELDGVELGVVPYGGRWRPLL